MLGIHPVQIGIADIGRTPLQLDQNQLRSDVVIGVTAVCEAAILKKRVLGD